MSNSKPLVSIGMPVYNGERFISEALDALLAQDYERVELIISDNGSTDRTFQICQDYIMKDRRISYHRNEINLGVIKNFNRVFDISNGKYFVWAADHDLWHPSFISCCVAVLEQEPEVVLAYPYTMLIDTEGRSIEITSDRIDTRHMSPVQRYRYLLWNLNWCNMVYGVIRSEILSGTAKFRNIFAPDFALLAELVLKGSFAQIPEPLFYRRENRPDERPEEQKKRRLDDLNPARKDGKPSKDVWRELRDTHLDIVNHEPLSLLERIHATIITNMCFMLRFKVRWHGFLFIERLVMNYLPGTLRRTVVSLITRLLGGATYTHQSSKK